MGEMHILKLREGEEYIKLGQAMNAPSLQKNFGICTTISARKPEKLGICPSFPTIRGAVSRRNLHGSPNS